MKHSKKATSVITFFIFSYLYAYGYDFAVDGIYYNITSSSKSTVEVTSKAKHSSYMTCSYSGVVVIPEKVMYEGQEYTVNRIGQAAFGTGGNEQGSSACYQLKSVMLPESIESIGMEAFLNCYSISKIIIPASVNSMESNIFTGCRGLKEIIMLPYNPPTVPNSSAYVAYYPSWDILTLTDTSAEVYVPQKGIYIEEGSNWSRYESRIVEMVTPSSYEFTYSGISPIITWTNNLNAYIMQAPDITLQDKAGNYSFDMKVDFYQEGALDFSIEFPYIYTIKKAPVTVKPQNKNREYGENNPDFSITYSGFLNGDNEDVVSIKPSISTTATTTSNVGEYPIIITGGYSDNYEFVYESGVLTVTKAPLIARVNDCSKKYGEFNPIFTNSYIGLKNGETEPSWITRPSYQTDANQFSGVGQYEVIAIDGIPMNYELSDFMAGTLNITPASLIIKALNATRLYYEENPQFSYACMGFMNGDDESVLSAAPVLSTSAVRTSKVGNYDIIVSEVNSINYSISVVNGTLTITPRTLVASVGNYSRSYLEDNPVFEVKCDGFVENENENVLYEKPLATTTANKTTDVGTYPITVYGGRADNYIFTYESGELIINKAEQFLSWEQDLKNLRVGDQIELNAIASSGLPITYSIDSYDAAEIYTAGTKTYLDCKTSGQFSIRAVQNGNNNYYSSPRVSNFVSIVEESTPLSGPMLTIKQGENGYIATQVSIGSSYCFNIKANSGWKIHSVTFNGIDVTNQLSNDNSFTTPAINANSILSIIYEQDGNKINNVNYSKVKILGMPYGIKVLDTDEDDLIQIYFTDGSLYKSIKTKKHETEIPLSKGYVYIVKVGVKTMKFSF